MYIIYISILAQWYIDISYYIEIAMKNESNAWVSLIKESIDIIRDALNNIVLMSFFIVSVCVIGGAGVWLPWITESDPEYFRGDNIFTYGVAILGGLLCDKLLYAKNIIQGSSTAAGLLFGCISLIFISVGYAHYKSESSLIAFVGVFVALIIHLMVTASDKKRWVPEDPDPPAMSKEQIDSTVGGSMDKPPTSDILSN